MSLTDSQTQLFPNTNDDNETEAERQQRKLRQRQFAKSSVKYICTQVPALKVMFGGLIGTQDEHVTFGCQCHVKS